MSPQEPTQMPCVSPRTRAVHGLKRLFSVTALGLLTAGLTGCDTQGIPVHHPQQLQAVGAESQYANVIKEIGGAYVSVYTVIKNPNVDPHEFQVGPVDAKMVGSASLVVQNGVGYDSFMNQLEAATKKPNRTIIQASTLMGAKTGVTNPHLWYQPDTMTTVATAVESSLATHDVKEKAVFAKNLQQFKSSLTPWQREITLLRQKYAGSPVAVTEPVADDLLKAAGLTIKTPWSFEAAVMNGIDPSPQSVTEQRNLLIHHKVKVFIYNPQAGDSITSSLLQLAKANHIPVVGAYETLPHGHTYATWMTAETTGIYNALKQGKSMETIK